MPRFALKIEYNGAEFSGWQRQRDVPTVQQSIEEALQKLEPSCGAITGAGRTDAGVHALGQVANCDLEKEWDPAKLLSALNYHLKPNAISIVACAKVDEDFSARFSAVERVYLFRILSRREPSVFQRGQVWQVNHALDADAMQAGANYLLGQHDFTTFRSVMCQSKSPVKSLDQLDVEQVQTPYGTEYHFHVRARSFLHNQVRSFVGTLERVGARRWTPEDVRDALIACDRAACGPVCPPQGLYLAAVHYSFDVFS